MNEGGKLAGGNPARGRKQRMTFMLRTPIALRHFWKWRKLSIQH